MLWKSEADYTCFTIQMNLLWKLWFLDYNENYHNLPYVGVLKKEGSLLKIRKRCRIIRLQKQNNGFYKIHISIC